MPAETSPETSPGVPGAGLTRRSALRGTVVAGVGLPLLAACGGDGGGADATDGTTANGTAGADGGSFATTADVPEGGGAIFADQGVVVTQPSAGDFKGFTNICTHRQCPLAAVTDTINCNCHGSRFSIEDGSPVNGPATAALAAVAIPVDGDEISLA